MGSLINLVLGWLVICICVGMIGELQITLPLWIDSPISGVASTVERLSTTESLQLGGMSNSCNHLGIYTKISVYIIVHALCFNYECHLYFYYGIPLIHIYEYACVHGISVSAFM